MEPHAKATTAVPSCPALLEEPGSVEDVQQSLEALQQRRDSLQQRIDKEVNPSRKAMLQKMLHGVSSSTQGLHVQPTVGNAEGSQSQLSIPGPQQRREERQRQVTRLVALHRSQAQEGTVDDVAAENCSSASSDTAEDDGAVDGVPCMDLDEAAALIAAATVNDAS